MVLSLMGLMIGLVTPRLVRLGESVEAATQRSGVIAEINALGQRAWTLGEAVDLSAGSAARLMRDGNPVLDLPEGWRLLEQEPIRYSASGFCEGGRLQVRQPDGVVDSYALRSPRCQVESSDDAALAAASSP
ncbi:MAG: hypothetical protein JO006_10070 [Paucibacter sp.]|nr:hypothetical protein [Roseateles sp.]